MVDGYEVGKIHGYCDGHQCDVREVSMVVKYQPGDRRVSNPWCPNCGTTLSHVRFVSFEEEMEQERREDYASARRIFKAAMEAIRTGNHDTFDICSIAELVPQPGDEDFIERELLKILKTR